MFLNLLNRSHVHLVIMLLPALMEGNMVLGEISPNYVSALPSSVGSAILCWWG